MAAAKGLGRGRAVLRRTGSAGAARRAAAAGQARGPPAQQAPAICADLVRARAGAGRWFSRPVRAVPAARRPEHQGSGNALDRRACDFLVKARRFSPSVDLLRHGLRACCRHGISPAKFKGLCHRGGPIGAARGVSDVRYVSTRGEAPPLGFADAMLAGLARDGGLYVPETWPRLDPPTIAGFAGRPYAEVAVEVIRRFVGDAIAEADLARMAREAYGTFRHPAVAPLTQLGAEHLRARAVPRADARLQGPGDAAPGAADGPCAGGARRAHAPSWSRPRAIPAAPRSRRSAAAARSIVVVLFPHGRISDVQRRMMTTVERRQRPRARHRRHVRRLPGDREGHVQPSRLPRPRAALRRQLDQLGAHRRAGRLLLHRRGRARRAASQGRLHGADRQFRRRLCRLCRACAWACRSTGW